MIYAFIAFIFGGILKGATGAGAPVIAIPVLAMLFDVQFAVTVFIVPNLLVNIWQAWQYRGHLLPGRFLLLFSVAGALGAGIGTHLLAALPPDTLSLGVAGVVFVYIAFRLLRSDWSLAYKPGLALSFPMGMVAGILQGATGISAPVSITFLNALRLGRETFIATISVFFLVMSVLQMERLYTLGLLDSERFLLGLAATATVLAAMPVGTHLAKKLSRQTFDRLILVLLGAIAIKIVVDALL
ncbi:sulfite exporter TauE/SafE family protein [Polymorphum gilvum]|uniref:Probable membrane transporter protein n=1 Tax=Polymorphum gilvum (strain LMG 25793 / CGMCC 1.9160 / SL003B-26A1) TaxID=991905 RepID=F2IYN2_POLGS|nr:sulfite exporter TauE/SafE family protein [Polymorphum gilvum]ADZ69479.1 Glutamine amidotransferase [Polymorphum gilvum SL003B-26A1]